MGSEVKMETDMDKTDSKLASRDERESAEKDRDKDRDRHRHKDRHRNKESDREHKREKETKQTPPYLSPQDRQSCHTSCRFTPHLYLIPKQ